MPEVGVEGADALPIKDDRLWRAPLVLGDFVDELLWPRLLRIPELTFRPGRIGLAFVGLLCILLIGELPALSGIEGSPIARGAELNLDAARALGASALSLDPQRILASAEALFVGAPGALWSEFGLWLAPVGIGMLVVWAIFGGAVCRSAICEDAQSVTPTWPESLAFSLPRWSSLALATIAPLLLVGFLLGVAALIGGLLAVPGLNIVGAVLFGLALVLAVLAALSLVCYLLGAIMLMPALACEGTDSFDAGQRVFHYVLHRPGAMVRDLGIVIALGLVTVGVTWLIAEGGIGLAEACAAWIGGGTASAVASGEAAGGIDGVATRIASFWSGALRLGVGAVALSFVWTGGSVLYLVMRARCDGQDPSEIWMPTMIEGTLAPIIEAQRDETPPSGSAQGPTEPEEA
ncbi:MAG: hypothetical protein H6811_01375 [Phycisphaeraceae bacterium]|nr:hypothetical protein [Phycisphaeraceae bacterium]